MQVQRVIQGFVFSPDYQERGQSLRPAKVVAELDEVVSTSKPSCVRADVSVRDCSVDYRFRRDDWASCTWEKRINCPRIALILDYSGKPVELPEVYRDLKTLQFKDFLRKRGAYVREDCGGRLIFDTSSHLMSPVSFYFFRSTEGFTSQRNTLSVQGYGDPNGEIQEQLKKICEEQGTSFKILTSVLSSEDGHPRFSRMLHGEGGGSLSNLPLPEFEVVSEWDGEDFDKKATHLYGLLRGVVYPAHVDAIRNFGVNALHWIYRNSPQTVILSDEGRTSRGDYPISDLHANFSCKLPFEDEGEEIVGDLRYVGFRGR